MSSQFSSSKVDLQFLARALISLWVRVLLKGPNDSEEAVIQVKTYQTLSFCYMSNKVKVFKNKTGEARCCLCVTRIGTETRSFF